MNKKDLENLLKTAFFDFKKPVGKEQVIFTIQEKIVGTKGEFCVISGLPKSRKTTFMLGILASAILDCPIWGMKIKIPTKEKILLIDTEQSNYSFSRQISLLKKLVENENLPPRLLPFLFRQYEPEQVWHAISELINRTKSKFIIIDNLTELCNNLNDMGEGKKISKNLMRITKENDCFVLAIIHTAKTTGTTVGNLGSAIDRVAQSVLEVTINNDTQTSTMKAKMMRSDAHFQPIEITYNKETYRYEPM